MRRDFCARAVLALMAIAFAPPPALAILDIGDRGPTLQAGNFAMRITNAGIIGNAFYNRGLSFDPSFEFPRGSGNEALNHAELWVGALDDLGHAHVSGGPMLEWRPTPDPSDHVLVGWAGQRGSRQLVDDDGDGKVDEEIFNGKDDDGDGEIDEDMGFPAQQVLAADYVDDRPEAINYGYPNGETHQPLGLSVHQEAYAWSLPGYDGIAGLQFTITNHGNQTLHDLYVGLFADLDSRGPNDPTGHLDDQVVRRSFSRTLVGPSTRIGADYRDGRGLLTFTCMSTLSGTYPVIVDGGNRGDLPAVMVMPLGHTTDPLGQFAKYAQVPGLGALANAPPSDSFMVQVFAMNLPPGQGGAPVLDVDRYAAMKGEFPVAAPDRPRDYAVLVSCGPFRTLAPGKKIEFAVAMIAASNVDSLPSIMGNAAFVYHGTTVNALPDSAGTQWFVGATGKHGHEACIQAPAGVSFDADPDCLSKFSPFFSEGFPDYLYAHFQHYDATHCIWTDADCDACTGADGRETVVHWLDPGSVPPSPDYHAVAFDKQVKIAWDNLPEVLLHAGISGTPGFKFAGYRVYKLSDFRHRTTTLPAPEVWERIAAFGLDSLSGERALGSITDSTLDYQRIRYGQKVYPIGRYAITDPKVLNGFDYLYAITTVSQRDSILPGGLHQIDRLESPLVSSLDSLVTPHVVARDAAAGVWVVPNPYRDHAAWDREAVRGDPFGRHIDFFGLPRAKSVVKIWTLAGDLVARVEHDGSRGDGEASWNLISRNGQDVESGVYLFTVDSPLGHGVGRFVIIR